MRNQIRDLLAADAALAGLLSGGIHIATEINRQETPVAFDANSEVLPCALVRQETTTPAGVHPEAARVFVRIFFYQQRGMDKIDAAMARCFALLDRQRLDGCWEIQHADDLHDLHDPGLNCSLAMSRYLAVARR
ncbi:MAG: hypothetical protein AB1453_10335 [Chloroflexota bacterium]